MIPLWANFSSAVNLLCFISHLFVMLVLHRTSYSNAVNTPFYY